MIPRMILLLFASSLYKFLGSQKLPNSIRLSMIKSCCLYRFQQFSEIFLTS